MTTGALPYVLDQNLAQLEQHLLSLGEPSYRARQIWHWLYHNYATSFAEMTDLPRALRERLSHTLPLISLETVADLSSEDGQTHKKLFRLADGATIESVLMLYEATEAAKARRTVCVSTQVGCALDCAFCATGQGGFVRNLSAGEIVGQVLHFARQVTQRAEQGEVVFPPITNVIFAGMGEPLANYQNTIAAVRRLNDGEGFGLGARHMIISTAGLAPGMRKLARENLQVALAVSLHAPSDELRARLMPINRRFPLAELLPACREFVEQTGRRIAFEYILIEGVNSLLSHARQLAALLKDMTCMVNLIPMNPVLGSPFTAPRRETVIAFQSILSAERVMATVRAEKGRDIQAACGQLRGKAADEARTREVAGAVYDIVA